MGAREVETASKPCHESGHGEEEPMIIGLAPALVSTYKYGAHKNIRARPKGRLDYEERAAPILSRI